jgi:acetyl-CoA carboxylase alpha subunit
MLARTRAPGLPDDKRPYTDGVITGFGTVEGRKLCVFSQDFTVNGGSLGEVFGEKVHKIMDLASSLGVPMVGINDGGGARVQEGVVGLHYFGGIFKRNADSSGVIPQISVIMGSCAGGAVYSPAMTDFIFMVRETSQMFITGPDVVKTVTGEEVTLEQLGGAMTHATKSGVATFVGADEKGCLDEVRYLLGFLPSNNLEEPPHVETGDDPTRSTPELRELIPPSANQPYDMKKVITAVVDDGDFVEYHSLWAMNLVCGFARIDGHVIGIVGNQPQVLAGVLDIESSEKGARFVRTCDSFNIPLVTFVDVLAGPRPGVRRHHPPRGQAALCLLRGHRPAGPGHHPQGLWRCVRRHELQEHRRRPRLRMALGRAGRHGPAGRRRHRVPPGAGRVVGPGPAPGRAGRRVQREVCQPLPGGRARLHRRRHRPGRHPPGAGRQPGSPALQARGAAQAQARQRAAVSPPGITPPPVVGGGQPTEEELVAIMAAVEVAWPRPVVVRPADGASPSLQWRFSGRWWTRSVIGRRDRPWVGPQH